MVTQLTMLHAGRGMPCYAVLQMLIDHLMENFGDRFDDISYVETFKQLRIKYDQSKERPADAAVDVASTSAATGRTFGRDLGRR